MGDGQRGFTPLTLLIAGVDVAAIGVAAALWWIAWVERDGENMPWVFGGLVAGAVVALLAWAISAGRLRTGLAAGTLLLIAAALAALFG